MSRYIDADALEKYLWEESESDFWINDPKVSVTYKDISIYVAKMPMADVRENVHGHWTKQYDEEFFSIFRCSACGKLWSAVRGFTPYELEMNFCPHCGAVMDEVTP